MLQYVLLFEPICEDIYIHPLICDHHDSYLYYIDTLSQTGTRDEPLFSISN